jgi:hypothetical protein
MKRMKICRPRRYLPITVVAGVALGMAIYTVAEPDGELRRSKPQSAADPGPSRPSPLQGEQAEIRWIDYSGMHLPISAVDGPLDIRDGLARRFTRSPQGALLAAVHITVRSAAQWGPKVFEPTITQQVMGPGQATLLAVCRDFYERKRVEMGLDEGAPLGRGYAVIEAYRWQEYSPDLASVDIVSAGPGRHGMTARASTRVQVRWHEDDWRVLAPPEGDWGNSATPLASAADYTPFQGRG